MWVSKGQEPYLEWILILEVLKGFEEQMIRGRMK
jgi:hypothetical protein